MRYRGGGAFDASASRNMRDDSLPKISPTHTLSVNRNLTAQTVTVHYRKQTLVWLHPESTSEVIIA
jgi:hypothetical protein